MRECEGERQVTGIHARQMMDYRTGREIVSYIARA
jgi:hypothetical protein